MPSPVLPPRIDPNAPALAAIAFGANLGAPQQTYKECLRRLNAIPQTTLARYSSLILTQPVGGPVGQPQYYNGAILVKTRLGPEELLRQTQKIELDLGRVRTIKNGPRTCDLDILLYDDVVWNSPDLVIPHPRMYERDFVLIPLREILSRGEAVGSRQ